MKRLIFVAMCIVLLGNLFSNGVAIVDMNDGDVFQLVKSNVEAEVENQVSIVKTTQVFKNNLNYHYFAKYGFPMPEGASAVQLRWKYANEWHTAGMSPVPQDSTGPGGGDNTAQNLRNYLGANPLYYDIEEGIMEDSTLTVELTYVQLLPYASGSVDFVYPNNYSLIQSYPLEEQTLSFSMTSLRTINSVQLLSHNPTYLVNNGNNAEVQTAIYNSTANINYHVQYSLSVDELGLFSMSNYFNSEDIPDEHGRGFFMFLAEPDPDNGANVIDKVFTLIIDRSGSMSGNKMVQARNAASFIVNHLNEGDRFNIVDFSSGVSCFSSEHVLFNTQTQSQALNYISGLNAGGSTNISGAFSTAIPQFDSAGDETANIIIFFTDGEATTGITTTNGILNHVGNLIEETSNSLFLFTFGIGPSVNEQLLTLLADQNNGLCELLGENELEQMITDFYMTIRNPVLINTEINFSNSENITEVYPEDAPNLYQGQQLIISGRYINPTSTTVTLSGTAFGQPITYNYPLDFSGIFETDYQFLSKIWAKMKIEEMIIDYYALDEDSWEAQELRDEIISISLAYGVVCEFTSYQGTGIEEEHELEQVEESESVVSKDIVLLGNYPNPFNPVTTISFEVNSNINEIVMIKIFNAKGQLVKILPVNVSGKGTYSVVWDGRGQNGETAASGMYFYIINVGDTVVSSKMVLMK